MGRNLAGARHLQEPPSLNTNKGGGAVGIYKRLNLWLHRSLLVCF
jgi:hypothetical protein